MSYDNDYNPRSGAFRGETGDRAREPACGAGELKALLHRIAEHIANADERQQATLEQMQTRLAHLAEEAQSARTFAPPELGAAFSRIEESIAALSDRLATGQNSPRPEAADRPVEERRDFWPDHPSDFQDPLAARETQPRPKQSHWMRSPADAPPPLRSAAAQFSDLWDKSSHQPRTQTAFGTEAFAPRSSVDEQEGDWDRASAEALTRLYEPDHDGQRAAPTDQDESQYRWSERTGGNESGEQLERRFAEIAAKVEKWLGQMNPHAIPALETRLDRIETKIGSALNELAKRANAEDLRAVEAHIGELAEHVERARSRLARLDEMDGHLKRLLDQVSDEHLQKLFEERVPGESRLADIAEAVANRISEQGVFGGEGRDLNRLRELHDVIADFVFSQRQNDQQTAGALAAIQEAVLNLLDRMDALEQTRLPSGMGRAQEADWAQSPAKSIRTTDAYAFRDSDFGTAAEDIGRDRSRAYEPTKADPAPIVDAEASVARAETGHEKRSDRLRWLQDEGPDEQSATTEAAGAQPLALRTSREEFLAAARRAAQKASQEAAQEATEDSRPGRRVAGARPVTGLLMATLAVALAVGIGVTSYNIYRGNIGKPWLLEGHRLNLVNPSAAGGSVEGGAAGGIAPADKAAGSDAPEVIIEDQPSRNPAAPDYDGQTKTARVTGVPGSIVDDGVLSFEDLGINTTPASLKPDNGRIEPPPLPQKPTASRLMPPATVGPLSLRTAAADGDPSAEFEVAVRLDEGRGVERNVKEAVIWYQRSASRGFAPAQYRLGTLYERGVGVPMDRGRAMAWYKSAAEKGHLKAMHNFAVLSASGEPSDYRTAARWFEEAASRGLVDSQYNLAILYESGRGVDRDLKQAYKWFALAARGGDKEAARRRDRVKWMLNAGELKMAEAMIGSWKPKPSDTLVNDARAAGEIWKTRDKQS